MKNLKDLFRRKSSFESEVNEELDFHLAMQTNDYESQGISPEQARAMAEKRFGDVNQISKECVRIGLANTVLIWILDALFMMSLVMGLLIRIIVPESHMNRVGEVMMMIGGLGILLVYAKQARATGFPSSSKNPLGLNTPPVGFDAHGRTPFDRVRSDD